jgi:3-hydroxyisobutyrate dehydrogenase
MTMIERVAFLGLGAIGRPMAARVARAWPLTVWNRTASVATGLATTTGAVAAATPAQAARGAQVVITCLPTSAEVEALLEGTEGLLAGLVPGSVLVDCTSGDPAGSARILKKLAAAGVGFLDAPVSGGTNGAEAGTLTVMVGGDPALLERVRPVLAAFGSRIAHMGPVGTGHAMKAVNNALLAVNILAVGEGLAALVKAGVPAEKALEVLNTSSGRSFVSETLVPDRVLTGLFPNTFRLALLHKDIGIAVALMDQHGVPADLTREAWNLFGGAREVLGESADYLEAIRLLEQEAGVEIRRSDVQTFRRSGAQS